MKGILTARAVSRFAYAMQAQKAGLFTDTGRRRAARERCCDCFTVGCSMIRVVCGGAGGAVASRMALQTSLKVIPNAPGVEGLTPKFCDCGCALAPGEYGPMCSGDHEASSAARIGRLIRRSRGNRTRIPQESERRYDETAGSGNITAVVIRKSNRASNLETT